MPADYTIIAQPERDLIRIALSGFFDLASLEGFDRARRAAHTRLRCAPNQHDTLVDLRGLKLQAQNIFDAFHAMMAEPATRSRRLVLVTGDSAIRMQVRRLTNRDDLRCFADMAAAERWLRDSRADLALAG